VLVQCRLRGRERGQIDVWDASFALPVTASGTAPDRARRCNPLVFPEFDGRRRRTVDPVVAGSSPVALARSPEALAAVPDPPTPAIIGAG
jgi:hypothetical protein